MHGKPSGDIARAMSVIKNELPARWAEEFQISAETTIEKTLLILASMHVNAINREAAAEFEAERVAQERAQLARLLAEDFTADMEE